MTWSESLERISERAESRHTAHKGWSSVIEARINAATKYEPGSADHIRLISSSETWKKVRELRAEVAKRDFEEDFDRHIEQGIAEAHAQGIEINYPVNQSPEQRLPQESIRPNVLRAMEATRREGERG